MCSNHELQATLNALGYLEDGEYYKSRDCLNASKDLIRYLRRDDPTEKTIRRELLKSDVISNDLIPLIKTIKSKKDAELFDLTLRLLVNLTQSALNCFENKIPEDKLQNNLFIEIDNQLKKVKESFADETFIKTIGDKLNEIVSKEWKDRPEEEELIAERILFLIRNILLIKVPDEDLENRLSTDQNSHDLLILSFHKTHLLETLVKMTGFNTQQKYGIHLLEILTLILREQSPEELAKVSENEVNLNSKRSQVEKARDNDELCKLQMKDSQLRKHNRLRLNPRHSRFMGTYVAVNMKSINDDNNLIVHKPAKNMSDLLDDSSKKIMKKAKNKLVLEANDEPHKSVLYIRIILKKFCDSIMKNSYNTFFRNLKDLMQRKRLEDDEVCYYYWLIQFLTEFNRNSDLDEQTKVSYIRETFSMDLFHSIEIFIQRCNEMMRMEKNLTRLWAKRMHTSLKCYKENLIYLFAMEKKILAFETSNKTNGTNQTQTEKQTPASKYVNFDSEDELVNMAENLMENPSAEPNSSNKDSTTLEEEVKPKSLLDERTTETITRLKDQIFKIQEFRELFLNMLRDYDQGKMSKNFLRDLIEANHIFILMLEHHTKKNGTLSVMSKKKQRKLKKKKSKKDNKKKGKKETKEEKEKRLKDEAEFNKRLDEQTEGFKEKIWSKSFSKVASLIQNETELNIENDQLMPFEFVATSDQEFDAQKDVVIEKIQHLLASNKPDDSIALFREARCLWPNDKELFGQAQVQADEEFETYKNLFMKKLEIKRPIVEEKENEKEEDEEEEKKKKDQDDEGIEDDLNNDMEGDEQEENKSANEYNSEDEDEEENGYVLQEEDLEFDKFLFRYTNPRILRSFILMLGEYAKNSDFLNRCCMSMFERISYECHAPQCLYQLSLFHLINKIHKDPMSRCIMNILGDRTLTQKRSIDDLYASTYTAEDMLAFFRQLIKKFFVQVKTNPKLYAEVLFFKDKRIIFELSEESNGYQPLDSGKNKNGKHRKVAWSEEEQDELKGLFEKYRGKFEKDQDEEIESSNNDDSSQTDENADLIDLIMLNIKDGSRQRREICLQLFNMKCVESLDVFKTDKYDAKGNKKKKLGRSKIWRPEDIDDLRQCFEIISNEAKETSKQLNEMMNKLKMSLKIKRNKNEIVNKLLDIGLIKDKSDILKSKKDKNKQNENDMNEVNDDENSRDDIPKKKKSKKSKEKSNDNGLFDAESDSDSSSESESDDESSSGSSSENESGKDSDAENSHKKKVKTVRNVTSSKLFLEENDKETDNNDEKSENKKLNSDKPKAKKKPIKNSVLRRMILEGSDDENGSKVQTEESSSSDNEETSRAKTKSKKAKKVSNDLFLEESENDEETKKNDLDSSQSETEKSTKKTKRGMASKELFLEESNDEENKESEVSTKSKKLDSSSSSSENEENERKCEPKKKTKRNLASKESDEDKENSDSGGLVLEKDSDEETLSSLVTEKPQKTDFFAKDISNKQTNENGVSKKRKKEGKSKVRIIDDSSNSSSASDSQSKVNQFENKNPMNEILTKASLKSDSENSSDEENVSLIALASKAKKQKLVLSDGEDE